MAWGTKQNATQLTNVTNEQFFSSLVSLNPGERAHVQVSVDFPATPTDHALVAVYTTLDDSAENWDDVPFLEFSIDNAIDQSSVGFITEGVYKFRVGIRRSGTTDTFTSADMSYRVDGVSQ